MHDRPEIKPQYIIKDGDMSASITSTIKKLDVSMLSITLVWTGTPTGSFDVEVSNDYATNPDGSVLNAGTWASLPLSASIAAAGAADDALIDIFAIASKYIRVKYTRTGGSGTLQAVLTGRVS